MTTQFRYEVGAEDYGVHEHAATRAEADTIAVNFKKRNPEMRVYIFDRMAHKGNAELFDVTYNGDVLVREVRS